MPQVRMEPFGREFAELAQVCMSAGVWPSGKATAFGAVIPGSNPGTPATCFHEAQYTQPFERTHRRK